MKRKILTGLAALSLLVCRGFDSGLLRRRLSRWRLRLRRWISHLRLRPGIRIRLGPSILRWIRLGARMGSWMGIGWMGHGGHEFAGGHGGFESWRRIQSCGGMVAADMTSPILDTVNRTIAADPTGHRISRTIV